MSNHIPARIIQTGRSRNLPLMAQAAVTTLKCLNPEYDYCFFDDTEVSAFVQKEFPQYYQVFETFPFRIQKFDFFRYLAVFRLGGFYFDTDVFFARRLDDLRSQRCVFPFEEVTISRFLRERHGMDWEIGNYGFGATAEHPFLAAVIENCVKAQQNRDWVKPMMKGVPRLFRSEFLVLNTTGPGLLSRTFAENPDLAKNVNVLFPDDICDESKWHQFGDFGVHLMEGSWRRKGNVFFRRLANFWEARMLRRGLAESRAARKSPLTKEASNADRNRGFHHTGAIGH